MAFFVNKMKWKVVAVVVYGMYFHYRTDDYHVDMQLAVIE